MKSTFRKGRENKLYTILLVSATILFAVFFTSKLWMYDDNPVAQTPFNKEMTGLEKTKVKLSKWEYNPEMELMEITIETEDNGDDVVKPSFSFEARERDSKDEYETKIVYQDEDNVVVQLLEVPDTFRTVGLFMIEHRDQKILEMEVKDSLNNSEIYDQEDSEQEIDLSKIKPAEQIIVGDYRKIKVNNELSTKSESDYKIQNLQREISMIEKEIEEIVTEKMPYQDELVTSIKEDIQNIEDGMEYETEEEKETSVLEIENKKKSIEKAEEEKDSYELMVESLSEKRDKVIKKLGAVITERNEEERKKDKELSGEKDGQSKEKSSNHKDEQGESKKKKDKKQSEKKSKEKKVKDNKKSEGKGD